VRGRDKKFNNAFARIVITAAAVLVKVHGWAKVGGPLILALVGSVVKLTAAYKKDGERRGRKSILNWGTAVFHACFGLAIREIGKL
jgi:hypothetical protein